MHFGKELEGRTAFHGSKEFGLGRQVGGFGADDDGFSEAVRPVDLGFARGGFEESEQTAYQRRLAGSIGSEQSKHEATVDGQGAIAKSPKIAIAFAETIYNYGGLGH